VLWSDGDTTLTNYQRANGFLLGTTLAVSLAGFPLVTPFLFNNFLNGRYLLGVGSFLVLIFCALNAWFYTKGRYVLAINLFGTVPFVIVFMVFAVPQLGVKGTYWCYLAMLSFYFMLPEKFAWISNAVLASIIFPLAWSTLEHEVIVRFFATFVATSFLAVIFIRVITRQQNRLNQLAITDALTGIYNRALLHDSLEQALHQFQRTGTPMTLITFDVDNFKSINDELGHEIGDNVLRAVGEYLRGRFRGSDKVFRSGGEEFLVLLFNTNESDGREIAEQLRSEFAQLSLLPDRALTISIGVASLQTGEDHHSWMKRSDDNLLRSKATGRNRVT